MHVLATWIAELVQFLYCSIINHANCNSGPFCTFKWTFLSILVDHSSGPFSGPFSDWGDSSEPREPPLATALTGVQYNIGQPKFPDYTAMNIRRSTLRKGLL